MLIMHSVFFAVILLNLIIDFAMVLFVVVVGVRTFLELF
jgi:hypothetical protein